MILLIMDKSKIEFQNITIVSFLLLIGADSINFQYLNDQCTPMFI